MVKNYVFLLLIIFLSCKDQPETNDSKKDISLEEIEKHNGKKVAIDSTLLSELDLEIIVFYKKNRFMTYWQDSENKVKLIQSFIESENEGLNPNDFDLSSIAENEKKWGKLSDEQLVNYDILLTKNLLRYIQLASKGKLKPKELYSDWDLRENSVNTSELLLSFQDKDSFEVALSNVGPQHIIYKKLKEALRLLSAYPLDSLDKIEITEKIVSRDTNEIVKKIKKRLFYWKDLPYQDSITAIYDEATLKAVKRFQLRHGLATDGVIGKGTVAALNKTKEQRKKQIIVNMERWRWYPRTFPKDYLIVNIPDYVLHVIKEKDTIVSHNIVVGTNARKTPILSAKLSYVVLNPTWTIPPTIIKEDVIPAASRSRSYFSKKNITIYDRSGIVVPPSLWEASNGKNYRYVQSPGSYNSLGMVKIIFPNRFMVYLHDTNHRNYFSRQNRSLSSGCVRVERPLELTAYLLNDSIQYNEENLKGFITDCNTKKIDIKDDIYLHQLYWTAWSANGQLYFIDDIYNLDEKLYQKLRN